MMYFRTYIAPLLLALSLLGLNACQNGGGSDADSAFESAPARLGETEVATVNGTKIYASDVERAATAQGLIAEGAPLSLSDKVFKDTLEELIDQRLLALDAIQTSLDQSQETRRRLMDARERILGNIRVESHLRDTVNEATIQRMYEEQSKLTERGEERRARHILVEDKKTAADLLALLQDGADFTALAKEKSMDAGSAKNGGDLDYFSRSMLDEAFTKPVFAAKIGSLIGPIKTEYGWHVVEVLNRRTPKQPSFEAMRPEIVNFMTFEAIQNLVKDLRKSGTVTLTYDDASAAPKETETTETEPEGIEIENE